MENDRTETGKENTGMETSCAFHDVKTLSRKAKYNNDQSPAVITHFSTASQVITKYTLLITPLLTPLHYVIMLLPYNIF